MDKPTIELFGINDDILQEVKRRQRLGRHILNVTLLILFVVWELSIAIIYATYNYNKDQSVYQFIWNYFVGFIVGVIPGILVYLLVVALIIAIYMFAESKILKEIDIIKKYELALARYHSWWQKEQEEYWISLSGCEFELELAKLFVENGYSARTTKASHDQGVDIWLRKEGKTIIVQCKHQKNPVGHSVLRDLYGTLHHFKADEAIIATITGITKPASIYIKHKPIRVLTLRQIIALVDRL